MADVFTNVQQYSTPVAFTPVNAQTGTSYAILGSPLGQYVVRSNATSAMTDTLPDPAVLAATNLQGDGWFVWIKNNDASASITLTPTVPATINGATTLTITAGTAKYIVTDGTDYFA